MPATREVKPGLVLATCCISLFLVSMDVTIVNVALPAIAHDLHASVAGLQWAIDGYTLVIASFLMLAGSTADRLGRRRVFQTGLAVFSAGSLLCSVAPTIHGLVAFRIVQALGGAMLNPVAMSIIVNTFTEPRARARAIGTWGAVFGISMALGPLLGGVLVDHVGWRSIFWINVPVALSAIGLTARFVPESRAPTPRRFDPIGQILVAVLLAGVVSALIEGPELGWHAPIVIIGFAAAAVAIVALIPYELRREQPLLELRFFRSRPFAAAIVLAIVAFTAFNGFLFLSSLYLQLARGMSAERAGLQMLPVAVTLVVCAPMSGRLVGAGRTRLAMVGAGVAMTIAAAITTTFDVATGIAVLSVGYALFGVGQGLVNTPITNAAVSGMPKEQAGVASALASTSRQVGASLGVAIAGTVGHGESFVATLHAYSWLVVACGLAVIAIGFYATATRATGSRPG
ncbi:MAG TPA: MFS transporter [Kofleriaceae bacterium]|jgi:EmrB/QacA subfamily drug resistance transporter